MVSPTRVHICPHGVWGLAQVPSSWLDCSELTSLPLGNCIAAYSGFWLHKVVASLDASLVGLTVRLSYLNGYALSQLYAP